MLGNNISLVLRYNFMRLVHLYQVLIFLEWEMVRWKSSHFFLRFHSHPTYLLSLDPSLRLVVGFPKDEFVVAVHLRLTFTSNCVTGKGSKERVLVCYPRISVWCNPLEHIDTWIRDTCPSYMVLWLPWLWQRVHGFLNEKLVHEMLQKVGHEMVVVDESDCHKGHSTYLRILQCFWCAISVLKLPQRNKALCIGLNNAATKYRAKHRIEHRNKASH